MVNIYCIRTLDVLSDLFFCSSNNDEKKAHFDLRVMERGWILDMNTSY